MTNSIGKVTVEVVIKNVDELTEFIRTVDEYAELIPDYYPEKDKLYTDILNRALNLLETKQVN